DARGARLATQCGSSTWRLRARCERASVRLGTPFALRPGADDGSFRGGSEEAMRLLSLSMTASLTLLGHLALAQSVTYDYDKRTDFSRLRTYAWTRGTPVNDELNHRRIVSAIEAQLSAHGLVPAAAGTRPDVLVAYHASFDRNLQINGFASGFGYRPGAIRTGTARAEEVL